MPCNLFLIVFGLSISLLSAFLKVRAYALKKSYLSEEFWTLSLGHSLLWGCILQLQFTLTLSAVSFTIGFWWTLPCFPLLAWKPANNLRRVCWGSSPDHLFISHLPLSFITLESTQKSTALYIILFFRLWLTRRWIKSMLLHLGQ
jgi:hypothetical protein